MRCQYVNHTYGICEDADDSAEVFYKHHEFLLVQMLKGEEGVEWVRTSIFQHLCKKFPDDHERIKAFIEKEEKGDDGNDTNEGDDEKSENEADKQAESRASPLDSGADAPKIQAEYQTKLQRRRGRKSVLRPSGSASSKKFVKGAQAVGQKQDLLSSSSDESDHAMMVGDLETPSRDRGRTGPLLTTGQSSHSVLSENETSLKTPLQAILQARKTSVPIGDGDDVSDHGDTASYAPDTWICPSCGKFIYKSNSKRSKVAIQDHSLAHADDMQTKLNLVFSEQRLNVLPVDNLVGRIKQFGGLDLGNGAT